MVEQPTESIQQPVVEVSIVDTPKEEEEEDADDVKDSWDLESSGEEEGTSLNYFFIKFIQNRSSAQLLVSHYI